MNGPQKFPRASALSHALGSVLPRCGLNAVSSSASILATIDLTLDGNAHAISLRSNGSSAKLNRQPPPGPAPQCRVKAGSWLSKFVELLG